MKIFLSFIAAVIILLAANSPGTADDPTKGDSEAASCSKIKCCEDEKANELDDLFLVPFNPIHI